jgi:ligand-binding SRPBCC domain-containing protein
LIAFYMPIPMPTIHLTTFIAAPIERVFDLSRNLTIYKVLMQGRKEKFSSGAASNLMSHGETITFHAKHFGKTRLVTTRVIELQKPSSFIQEQVKGDLLHFKHEHYFKPVENGTILIDMIDFDGPRDVIGKVMGKIYLKNYLEKFIHKRNILIQQYAESDKWRAVLS